MLTIIVIYLLYSGSVNGKLVGKSCLQPNFDCLKHRDCCSNSCRRVDEEVFGICTSEADEYLSSSIIKLTPCFKFGHFCIENSDCCSKECITVKSHFHGVLRACTSRPKSDK